MGVDSGRHRAGPRPGVIRITKAGWLYIAVTLFLGFSAVNTGNNLLFLIVSAFLSFMGISGFFGKRNLSKIEITVEFPEEIYAKTNFPLKVGLHNTRGFLPAFLIKASLNGGEVLFPFVDAGASVFKYIDTSFNERGRVKVEDIRICSVFPFNFFVRCGKAGGSYEKIVFPQARPCELTGILEREKKTRGEKAINKSGYETEILSIRDYVKGDPFKFIHWKASARTGELKTKELSSLSNRPVIIDFEEVPINNIEDKISCVTYMIVKLFKRNVPVGLRIRGALYKPLNRKSAEMTKAGRNGMLKTLALYQKE